MFTRGNQAVDDSGPLSAGVTSRKHPISASDGHRPKNPLRQVVIDGKVAVVDVSIQSLPLSPGVTHCLTNGLLGRSSIDQFSK
jgi:hypothetical protein